MTSPLIKFVESVCVQTAVYWGAPQADGYGGWNFSSPVEISVRWDDKVQLVVAQDGQEVVSNSEVLLTQDVDEGGYLYLGELTDLTADEQADPKKVKKAYRILRKGKTPLFKSTTEFVRMVWL